MLDGDFVFAVIVDDRRLSFTTFGLRVGVEIDAPDLLEPVLLRLPPGRIPIDGGALDRRYRIHRESSAYALLRDSDLVETATDVRTIVDAFETDLNVYVAEMNEQAIFVHAGVVAWAGHAIVLPGRSYAGKTTLVASLIQAGATYYSDEYAAFDESGCVLPYARALAFRTNGDDNHRSTAAQLGGREGQTPVPVGMIARIRYADGEPWQPRVMSTARGLLALVDNCLSIRRQPHRVLPVLNRAAAHAVTLRGFREDTHGLARDLFERLEDHLRLSRRLM